MGSRIFRASLILSLVAAGCARRADSPVPAGGDAVALVPAGERSRHFEAVSSHLELGGTLYGYADIDGDALALAAGAQSLVHQIAAAQPKLMGIDRQNFKALFSEMGLNDVKAVGFSSVLESGGTYRNRTFLYTPEGRHGLLAAFGGQPGRFLGSKLAPSDCDFYSESEFDVSALYDSLKAVVAKAGGRETAASLEKMLKEAGGRNGFSLLDVIEGLDGRITVILRMDPNATLQVGGTSPVVLPAVAGILRIDGIGPAVAGALAKDGGFEASRDGTLRIFTPRKASPVEGLQPILAVEGKTFFAATSAAFLKECLHRTEGLETNPEFASGLAALGPEGNGVTWVSQRFFSSLRSLGTLNPNATPEQKRLFDAFALNVPIVSRPLFSVRSNLPDGILVRSNWNKSLKSDLAMFTVYNPVTIGLMAAMAIPAYQKVQAASQQMTVMSNLRSLHDAAEQFYLINGATSAAYDQLVGPGKYVAEIHPVMGEDYASLSFTKGQPLQLRLPSGQLVSYPPESGPAPAPSIAPPGSAAPPQANDPKQKMREQLAVVSNLFQLYEAARKYHRQNHVDTVAYADLVGPGKLVEAVTPVAGEDYSALVFVRGQRVEVRLADGRIVRYPLGKVEAEPAAEGAGPQQASPDPQSQAIIENLQRLNSAAESYYADHNETTTTYERLVGPGKYLPSITPVAGEDYRSLLFKQGRPLRLYLKDGRVLVFPSK